MHVFNMLDSARVAGATLWAASGGCGAIGLQVGVEPPDQRAHAPLGGAVGRGEGLELVDQPLGMHPAQRMLADGELAGAVADDHRAVEQAALADRTPDGTLGGDAGWILRDRQCVDVELAQMGLPGGVIGKAQCRCVGQARDQGAGQGAAAHVVQGRGVDDVAALAGA
jgi:hypothetical protein